MTKKTAVLAFSGGLDTSFCVPWLQEQGYSVVTVTVDTGGFSLDELRGIEARSAELGAVAHHTVDGREDLWKLVVTYIIKGNILRGGVYPLCAGPERVVQAMHASAKRSEPSTRNGRLKNWRTVGARGSVRPRSLKARATASNAGTSAASRCFQIDAASACS